jgi:HEPN domain-containing protein
MPGTDEAIPVAAEWFEKAEHDLKAAAYLLKMKGECPTDTVCFHAQQAVEKYLKAWMVVRGAEFPKTHDIEALLAKMPRTVAVQLTPEDQRRLTAYATITRYPGSYEPISMAEARHAVRLVRQVQKAMRGALPKNVLGGKKRRRP